MGLFRRREASAAPAVSPDPPAGNGSAPAPDPDPPAWTTLPPLTPTVSAPASTFKIGAAVKEDLVALDSPRLSHGMGHLVSADGPPGVISGLARIGVQRQASTASGGALDMPMAPTGVPDGHYEGDGHDHSSPGASFGDAEPAGASTVFVPHLEPDSNGNGNGDGPAWSPPASPISAAAAAPTLTRDLPLAPAVQRQADPASEPVAEPSIQRSAAGPSDAATAERSVGEAPSGGRAPSTPDAPGAPDAAVARPSLTLPTAQRTATDLAGGPPPDLTLRTAQRTTTDPSAAATGLPSLTLPTAQRTASSPSGVTLPTAHRSTTDSSGGTLPSLTLPTAQRSADLRSVQRQAAEVSDGTLPLVQRHADEPAEAGSSSLPLAAVPHHEAEAAVTGGADDAGDTAVTAQRSVVDAPRPRPRAGALGPPLETRPLHAPMAIQRSSDAAAVSAPEAAATPPLAELPIRQRVHPGVQRRADSDGGVLRPAGEPGADAAPSLPVAPDPSGRTAGSPPAPAPEPEPSTAAAEPAITAAPEPPAPSLPLPVARAVGRGEAPDVPLVGRTGPVGFLPLVAQRSLAGPASVPAPAARQVSPASSPAVVPSWSVPSDGAVVQRWPSLSSVRDAGKGLTERAKDALPPVPEIPSLPETPSLPQVPDLPETPSLPQIPDLPSLPQVPDLPSLPTVPKLPGLPSMPGMPGVPSLPQLPSLPPAPALPQVPGLPSLPAVPSLPSMPLAPSLPQLPSMPSLPGMPSLPVIPGLPGASGGGGGGGGGGAGGGDVPMTEITFPAPPDGGGGGTTPAPAPEPSAPAPAPAAAPSGGTGAGAAGTGDLDELAHKLYDRIRWRMRSELRLDMERAGLGAGTTR